MAKSGGSLETKGKSTAFYLVVLRQNKNSVEQTLFFFFDFFCIKTLDLKSASCIMI